MRRETLTPREGWQKRLEDAGCYFHTIDGAPYWRDDAAYVLTGAEVDKIEDAADQLNAMCFDHACDVVRRGDYEGYGFPDEVKALIEVSMGGPEGESTELSLIDGRFDLGYDGDHLKLFEFNADTPTALPEASIWQYHALQDRGWPDQFNSIHERLLEQFKTLRVDRGHISAMHFAASEQGAHEDFGNLHYMMEVATEAGFTKTSSINIEQIGWLDGTFVDLHNAPIEDCFKLYPWEWLMMDEFGWKVREARTRWIEPAWKMLLSTKALLPLLWRKHEGHPLLLEAHFDSEAQNLFNGTLPGQWLRKPLLGREGVNITRLNDPVTNKPLVASYPSTFNPKYDKHGYVVQRYFESMRFGGRVTPVLGVWVVGDKACGLGIREDDGITTNASCFVPHYFQD